MLLYYVYRKAFYTDKKHAVQPYDEAPFKGYKENKEQIYKGIARLIALPYEDWEVKSFDGLKLYGRFYNFYNNAPLLIFFHGYKSNGLRDAVGAVKLCQEMKINLLIVDQRAHQQSEGKTITFGVYERFDCKRWIEHAIEKLGTDLKIMLFGISMGASTVLMASELNLPNNVKGIIADCGYSSPVDILKAELNKMRLPSKIFYPLLKRAAKIYGGFDVEASSAEEALKKCSLPVVLMHGGEDDLVPCEMSKKNFEACASKDKRLLIFPHSAHGMSYYEDTEKYESACKDIINNYLKD